MLLGDLLAEVENKSYANLEITNVTSRIEEINEGSAFVFQSGVFQNKAHLLYEAEKRNPKIIISEIDIPLSFPCIKVKNARRALSEMIYKFYFHEITPPPIVAITGTNGKSSTLQMLYHLFRDKYKIGLLGTQRIEIDGTPLHSTEYTMTTPDPETLYKSLFEMTQASCDYIFMEVSSHALALEKVSPLFFEMALFTGLSDEHLDFHKTKENYIKAKEKIFYQSLYQNSVLNID